MHRSVIQNTCVVLAAVLATAALVVLEVRVLASPPSGFWFAAVLVLVLLAFARVNAGAFRSLSPLQRAIALPLLVVSLSASTGLIAVVFGANLKFALGGHL